MSPRSKRPRHPLPFATWAHQLYAREGLREVAELSARSGIELLPVKGIVTAYLLYEDPAERPISDIDVRVRPRDLRKLRELGLRSGWHVIRDIEAYGGLVLGMRELVIDVETYVGPPGVCALSIDTMIQRSRIESHALGFPHREPELHDHALLLCVNAFKDKLIHAAPWAIGDLERVVLKPSFDSERFVELARANRSHTLVWIVAQFMEDVGGSASRAVWASVAERLGTPPRAAYAKLVSRLIASGDPAPLALRLLARAVSDRTADFPNAFARMFVWQLQGWLRRAKEVESSRG